MPGHSGLHYNTSFQQLLAPANHTAAVLSSSLDLQNYDMAELMVSVGANVDTLSGSVRIECAVQSSDDNVTFAAVPDTDLTTPVAGVATGTFAVINANSMLPGIFFVGYIGNKRYVKVQVNYVGATSGEICDVLGLAGRPKIAQVNA
jgi:hypothetical protein